MDILSPECGFQLMTHLQKNDEGKGKNRHFIEEKSRKQIAS